MSVTYIFGHRNPDTDSVCSAISLSYLKNALGDNTVPRVLGHINKETKFVLDYFNVKEPEYLNNAKIQIRNVHYNKGTYVYDKMSIKEVIDYMLEKKLTAVPVVDENKKLISLITLKEIALLFINTVKNTLNTSYDKLLKSLNGKEIIRFREEFDGTMMVASYQSQTFMEQVNLKPSDILIMGDRHKVLEYGILNKISLIVLTNNFSLPDDLLELAKKNKVSVISSPMDTYNTCNAISLSNYVRTIILNHNPSVVYDRDYLTDFIEMAHKQGFSNYPVLNKKGDCLGMIKVTEAGEYDKMPIILVDHNQLDQSIPGIEEANIMEIIDHHNLGAIGTNVPINFRSMPVGCTCTILYYLYLENKIDIPFDIAGIMLSAILSDTLIFQSPTTTDKDREAAQNLAKICQLDISDYGYQMLKAGSSIENMSIDDIIFQDFKSYKISNTTLGISQIITMDFEHIKKNIDDYVKKLDEIAKGQYEVVTIFITDIIKNGSYVLYNSQARDIILDSYDLEDISEGTFIPNLISRKKQMLPKLMETLEKRG